MQLLPVTSVHFIGLMIYCLLSIIFTFLSSRFTSGAISPSDLPDSPNHTVPPSPKRSRPPSQPFKAPAAQSKNLPPFFLFISLSHSDEDLGIMIQEILYLKSCKHDHRRGLQHNKKQRQLSHTWWRNYQEIVSVTSSKLEYTSMEWSPHRNKDIE